MFKKNTIRHFKSCFIIGLGLNFFWYTPCNGFKFGKPNQLGMGNNSLKWFKKKEEFLAFFSDTNSGSGGYFFKNFSKKCFLKRPNYHGYNSVG